MRPIRRPSPLPYGVAVFATLLAVLLRIQLGPLLDPNLLLLAAVIFSAWYGGVGPGLLTTALSVAACTYLFLPPGESLVAASLKVIVQTTEFTLVALLICWLNAARSAWQRAEVKRVGAEAAERRFRDLVHGLDAIVWEGDAETFQFTFVSKRAEQILGYPVERWLTEPDFWVNSLHPADREPARRLCLTATREGRDHEFEYRAIAADGRVVWFHDVVRVILNDQGKARQLRGVMVDITARKRAEQALRESEARFRDMFNHSNDAIFVVDLARDEILDANPKACAMLGYSREELLALPVSAIHPRDMPDLLAFAHTISEQRPGWTNELTCLTKSGQVLPAEISASLIEIAGQPCMLALVRDITERKAAEEALRFLAEASTVLSASLDYETTLAGVAHLAVPRLADYCTVDVVEDDESIRRLASAHVNPSKEQMASDLQRLYPPDLKTPCPAQRVLRTGRSEIYREIPGPLLAAKAQDAKHRQMLQALGPQSAMVVPLVARERALGVITFVSAESGRHYGPVDLALAEDLARRAALAVDNARLYHEAREAVRVRDEFLSSVSHDLKNPLAMVKGHAQLLKRLAARLRVPETERMVEGLVRIDTTATKMAAMINELLDLARLQIGQPLALNRRPTDLVALARQAVVEYQQAAERHRIRLDAALPQLTGTWDAARLERVLGNLLSNAIKYSPNGGDITVRAAREERAGEVWAVLAVQDQGIGIPAADRPHVFERFHRAKNVAGRIAGTGIGLAGACQIVQQHGGTIAVESEEGKGSTFTVRLPLVPAGCASYTAA